MIWNQWSNSPSDRLSSFIIIRVGMPYDPPDYLSIVYSLTRYGRNLYECFVKQLRLALKLLFKDVR
jgi:hypothetical protein